METRQTHGNIAREQIQRALDEHIRTVDELNEDRDPNVYGGSEEAEADGWNEGYAGGLEEALRILGAEEA
jgi:hypothetical protein